ncbi:MAG: hypothetical protein Q9162_002356 [Coniocarpon cinnabarinum]
MDVVEEVGADQYHGTKATAAFTQPQYRDGLIYCYDVAGPSFRGMPNYLKKINYAHPNKLDDGPFQYAHNTDVPFFAWLGNNPQYLEIFNNYMAGYRQGKPSWTRPDFFPIAERLGVEHGYPTGTSGALIVDVGGGMGHDLQEFQAQAAHLSGKRVLQERPEVLQQIKNDLPGVELMEHDFFKEQPVKGARAYYMHSVLHDWQDDQCRQILNQLRPAMTANFSKLLINELIVPDSGAAWHTTSMDWLMMALGAVRERTKSDWVNLLDSAGFSVVKIWTYEQGTESLIEAELKK